MYDDTQDVGALLKQVEVMLGKRMNNVLREHGLTRSQAMMLHDLDRRGGEATLKELEQDARVAQSSTWGVAKRLEEKGLVVFAPDPNDARARVVSLTEVGHAQCIAAARQKDEFEKLIRQMFSTEELNQFKGYLRRMRDELGEEEE